VRNEEKKEYHYKKTGPINLTSMAKRLNNTVGDVLKLSIQVNKLQPGMDQMTLRMPGKNGNGVNSYTKNVVLKKYCMLS
jgi:hypothetical protein